LHFDNGPNQCQFKRRIGPFSDNGEFYFAAGFTAHGFNGISQRHAFYRFIIKLDNKVSGFYSRFLGWRIIDR